MSADDHEDLIMMFEGIMDLLQTLRSHGLDNPYTKQGRSLNVFTERLWDLVPRNRAFINRRDVRIALCELPEDP